MQKFKTTLITDSREQAPLEFRKDSFDNFVVEGVPFADYWLRLDMEDGNQQEIPIVMERKGLGDLFGTMTSGYERFKREMERAKEVNCHMMLLVEGSMREVSKGYEHSQFSGDSMLKKLAMLRVKYDLEVHFFNDRREMARFIEEIFGAVVRNYSKETK